MPNSALWVLAHEKCRYCLLSHLGHDISRTSLMFNELPGTINSVAFLSAHGNDSAPAKSHSEAIIVRYLQLELRRRALTIYAFEPDQLRVLDGGEGAHGDALLTLDSYVHNAHNNNSTCERVFLLLQVKTTFINADKGGRAWKIEKPLEPWMPIYCCTVWGGEMVHLLVTGNVMNNLVDQHFQFVLTNGQMQQLVNGGRFIMINTHRVENFTMDDLLSEMKRSFVTEDHLRLNGAPEIDFERRSWEMTNPSTVSRRSIEEEEERRRNTGGEETPNPHHLVTFYDGLAPVSLENLVAYTMSVWFEQGVWNTQGGKWHPSSFCSFCSLFFFFIFLYFLS